MHYTHYHFFTVAQVVTDVSQRNVTEGGDSIICVRLNTTSVRETTVVLTTTDRSATGRFNIT